VLAQFADTLAPIFTPGDITTAASRRAAPGDTNNLYGIGFGPVTPDSPAGQIVQQYNSLVTPLRIFFGGEPATHIGVGLIPGDIGLYQIVMIIPDVPAGDAVPLTFNLGGTSGPQTL
jgi:uncharacterized protein (TIGR03437 family)